MKINYRLLAVCISIPLAVGALSALLTRSGMEAFSLLNKPTLSPPGFLFPIVWSILYALMGTASYLILTSGQNKAQIVNALYAYGLQLIFNFFWSIWFFNLEWYLFAFIWLLVLWILILNTLFSFYDISKPAAYLLVPYLLWVTFAGYLNLSVYLLN